MMPLLPRKKIKGWLRQKKNKLIESINPSWDDLASTFGDPSVVSLPQDDK